MVREAPLTVDLPGKDTELVLHVVVGGEQVVSPHVLELLALSEACLQNVAEENHIGLSQSQRLHRLDPVAREGQYRLSETQQHRLP